MIEINNLTFTEVKKSYLKKVVRTVLKGEEKKDSYLSIAFIGALRMKKLNNKYLKRNYPTDVLVFLEKETYPEINNLGEIVICLQVVKRNAKKFNLTFEKELSKVLIHGVLHLLGYDHEKSAKKAKEMEKKENYYLKKLF